jgi:hypothetical protein
MTELHAFDAASPTIPIQAMVQHGAIVAPVYFRGTPGGMQPSDAARVKALRAAGLAPWPNWESTADFFRTATLDDCRWAGRDALQHARACGFPDDGSLSIPFSFDYQANSHDFPLLHDKLEAAQESLGGAYRACSYAQSGLISYLHGHGFGDVGHWLMASTWGLPYNITQPGVAIVQSHHADGSWFNSPIPGTDANVVTQPDKIAAWWPDGSEFANMPTAKEIAAEVVAEVFGHKVQTPDNNDPTFTQILIGLRGRSLALTPAALAKAVAAKMPAVDEAQLESALRDAFVSLGGTS